MESGSLSYATVGEFLSVLKEEFEGEDDKILKVVELKKVKQGNKIIEEFVQEFRRVARASRYEGRLLIKKFKRKMNKTNRKKLMKAKRPPRKIEQWYE